ncbi:LicD family protein [Qipengyuania marisflavi]|uniref:LicD family protein n=1 Tax=Qipengyuania marisflavi TaxID=2486356 RepID=A0A5S3PFN4_9SPHN|nr:LicD family protein [Qipengyuania marisflavi]TMM50400.1 LicD family protein [Qipengyuania marisflavi]
MRIAYENGEPSADLQRLQQTLLAMCAKLLTYCEQRGIAIFLIGGTALGALRDGEIIPWDDDIDLALLRPDYERLMLSLAADSIPGMSLQEWRTEPRYHYPFAKLRLDGSSAGEVDFAGTGMHEGLFLDIFPYDRLPLDEAARERQRRRLGLLNLVILPPVLDPLVGGKPLWRRAARGLGLLLRQSLPLRWFVWLRERVQQASGAALSDEYDSFGMLGISQWRKKVLRESDLVPPRPAQFGPVSAAIPANCERFCELHYGNWRDPPPPEHRRPIHVGKVVLPE